MVSNEGKQGIALLVVIIVVLATLAVVVGFQNSGDNKNPNGILGTYEIVDYTQYGGEGSSENWEWYTTGCGAYEGEKIRIDSYDNGTIRATCMIKGQQFEIIGYYDPDTGDFGYTSYYDYLPGSKEKVIDWLQGEIIGDTMYLRGYTMSAESVENPSIYTFNFTFVKEGKTAKLMPIRQALSSDSPMESTKTWAMVGTEETDIYPYDLTLSLDTEKGKDAYLNGVYQLTETTKDSEGNVEEAKMTATTIYQDSQRTILRAIGYYGPGDYNVCWYVIEGKHMYCLFNSNAYLPIKNVSCRTLYTSDGTEPTFAAPYDFTGKKYSGTVTYDSSDNPTSKVGESYYVITQGKNSNVAVTTQMQVNILPGINAVTYFFYEEEEDVSYYGDMMGSILSNGDLYIYGFVYGSDGEALYVHGTLKASSN